MGIMEHEQVKVDSGKWASIVKESWQPSSVEYNVLIPIYQSAVIAAPFAVGVPVFLLLVAAPVPVAVGVGALAACVVFRYAFSRAVSWSRDALTSREVWESETAQLGQASKSHVVIELIDRETGRMVFEELETSLDTLRAITKPGAVLSKRGLSDSGIGETQAMRLINKMIELSYAIRLNDNMPAQLTSKGKALRKAFWGGGGVVVGRENNIPTSEI